MPSQPYSIKCHCNAVSQQVQLRTIEGSHDASLSLCHCDTCRHMSGVLCTSYYPVSGSVSIAGMKKFLTSSGSKGYFCATCGCHVARCTTSSLDGRTLWEVSSGCLIGDPAHVSKSNWRYETHKHVSDTKDGGCSEWLKVIRGQKMVNDDSSLEEKHALVSHAARNDVSGDVLNASCACENVRFYITRPNETSYEPKRGHTDLMYPYNTTEKEVRDNPQDEKWWIQGNGKKYLAGTCACEPCRLVTGFEIQTWAFVPRTNIFFTVAGAEDVNDAQAACLDFDKLDNKHLQSYTSSPHAVRHFCGNCGATVFWREKHKPDIIDVSVGLFIEETGARAENWLEWWTGRVSFAEETKTGRLEPGASTASDLIEMLEEGLEKWGRDRAVQLENQHQ